MFYGTSKSPRKYWKNIALAV
uniref:Uncharacterized protein n=1 Tax=Arundo donax TaxID=35708 RepID=A0A0A9FCI0_ARUDO